MTDSLYPRHSSGELPKVTPSGLLVCSLCGANMLADTRPHAISLARPVRCLDCERLYPGPTPWYPGSWVRR